MNEQDQVVEIAKVDEPNQKWEIFEDVYVGASEPYKKLVGYRILSHSGWQLAKDYLHSRDAIVPVIEKQPREIQRKMFDYYHPNPAYNETWERDLNTLFLTPAQLCEILLRATRKWKD